MSKILPFGFIFFKLSHGLADCGRWGHRPRRAASVGVSTNRQQFEVHSILPFGFIFILMLLLNNIAFSQKKFNKKQPVKSADSEVISSSLNNEIDSLNEWKNSRDFRYMNYLDSLLRKQSVLDSASQNGKKNDNKMGRERNSSSPANLEFLNSFPVRIFFWLLAVFFIGFIFYRLFWKQGIFSFNRRPLEVNNEEDVSELFNSSRYDSKIMESEKNNDFTLSTRYLYLQVISVLSEKGLIMYSRDKTNREYLLEMKKSRWIEEFSFLTRFYEFVWYGKSEIDETKYQSLKNHFSEFIKKVYSD